ncbi:MAG: DUF1002 domain-containing protein [Thermoanaerobacterales bacterium]|jgi:uncharacterized protein YpuA (DUF1002 family)|nr:DUF1002 domain-containing protein [Thermoanaerobacterales bacterium]
MKKTLGIFALSCMLMLTMMSSTIADQGNVVSLGADLTQKQQEQILSLFDVNKEDVMILTVTNDEERDYLEGLVPEKQIGTRAISSAYVKLAPEGSGIDVKTHNITWVTEEMYANAMVTAGIEDAQVMAAAPFKVSGTAALTGIMKAFERASGQKLSSQAKQIANEELVITGDLGDEIGKEKAVKLIQNIKKRVVEQDIKEPEDIRKVIQNIAVELNIQLTDSQVDRILSLMEKISRLNLNVDKISQQLGKMSSTLDEIKRAVEENKGLIQKIFNIINNFFGWLQQIFSK